MENNEKIFKFSKGFLPCAILSLLIIISGVVAFFVKGVNFGIDFRPGLIQEINVYGGDIESVRTALKEVPGVAVKELGKDMSLFQIRVPDNKKQTVQELSSNILDILSRQFQAENVILDKTDFIGSSFSSTLMRSSILLLLGTLALIWLYAAVRFHWDMALGAVLAVIHDGLIMLVFICFSQMEFTTITLAAILTIIGYSINATVVILDRVRANATSINTNDFKVLLDVSLTQTFSRSLITTITTMLAVGSLYIFTTGSMKDFALSLLVGLVSGLYSSLFISSGFISLTRKNYKPKEALQAVPKFQVVK